jgi:prepilin-type processing-associated H-X9-DG protein
LNQFVGESSEHPAYDPRVLYLFTPGQCSSVPPSEMLLFIDEHEDSIDDGYFLVGAPEVRKLGWENVPAARHNKSGQFVFVDGHTEKHRWKDPRTLYPVTRVRIFAVDQPNSKDVAWFFDHTVFLK